MAGNGLSNRTLSALSEPRAFLLFIFLVLVMFEYAGYLRTQGVQLVLEKMLEANQQTVMSMADLVEQCHSIR